jgi:hypothetical protein
MSVQSDFKEIMNEWKKGAEYTMLYHLIIKWTSKYYNEIKDEYAKYDILVRTQYDSPNKIVDDFIHADCYRSMRGEFGHRE